MPQVWCAKEGPRVPAVSYRRGETETMGETWMALPAAMRELDEAALIDERL